MTMTSAYDSLLQVASARHSTRCYVDRPVAESLIDKIVAVAKTSPYASGRKNWGIQVISDRDVILKAVGVVRARVRELVDSVDEPMQADFTRYSRNFVAFESAPVVLVPYFRTAPLLELMICDCPEALRQFERDNMVKSISCVSMLITLAAESLGLGSCYITGALVAESDLRKQFHIPNGRHVGAVIPIGYEDE